MAEETSKVIDRRRLRSLRMAAASKKNAKKDNGEDPSAATITKATSTGIDASLMENQESTEELSGANSPKKIKKKKKNSGDENTLDPHSQRGKRSKKKKKSESVGESIKSSKKKKKASSNIGSSSHHRGSPTSSRRSMRKSRTKYRELEDENNNSDSENKLSSRVTSAFTGCVGGKAVDDEAAEDVWRPPKETKGLKATEGAISAFQSPGPISSTKSRSDREDSSLRDIQMASPVDRSVSKRDNSSGRLIVGSLPSFGSSSIDDDDTPFWKKSSGGSRRNSPIPSLEEDDTIFTHEEDVGDGDGKYIYPKPTAVRPKPTAIRPPSLSDDEDDNYESSSEEESSSDEEPEWLKKKRMFLAQGKKVAYEPPPKEPEISADEDEEDEQEPLKESLPPWANARKALKKTRNTSISVPPAPVAKEKEDISAKEEKTEEQVAPKTGLPSWAQDKRTSLKKTGSTRSTPASGKPVTHNDGKNESFEKESVEKGNDQDASKAGLPAWAQGKRTPLKKTRSKRNTTAPAAKSVTRNDEKNESFEKESVEKGDDQDSSKAGLPAWAQGKRKPLKKTGSKRNTTATVKTDAEDKITEKEKEPDEKEGEQDAAKAGLPAWANARKSLKKSESRRKAFAPVAAPISVGNDDDENDDKNDEAANESDIKRAKKKNAMIKKNAIPVDIPPPATKTIEPKTDNISDRRPPWAMAKHSLKSSSGRSLQIAPPEEKIKELDAKKDTNKDFPKAKSYQSSASRPSSAGISLWAKKKPAASRELSDVSLPPKGDSGCDRSSIEENSDPKVEDTVSEKSATDRLSRWGDPYLLLPRSPSVGNSAQNASPSTNSNASSSRKVKIGKSQSERSMLGSPSVTSLGSLDSQGTTKSHRNRTAAYLENISKPPIVPVVKNRDQVGTSSEQSLDNSQKNAKSSVTPQVSNKRGSRVPSRTSSGNLSVKDRTKAWGGSSHSNRDGDISSVGTGGALSVTDRDDEEEKSVPRIKNRMKAWNQNTATKSSKGIPTKVSITKSADQDEEYTERLRPPSPFTIEKDHNTILDKSDSSETDSYDRDKAKIWSAKSSPVPAYAAGRMALKKVKKDAQLEEDKDSRNKTRLVRMYSSENLKKVTRPRTSKVSSENPRTKELTNQKTPSFKGRISNKSSEFGAQSNTSSSDVEKKKSSSKDTVKEVNYTESDSVISPIYATKLRKVEPPDESKWKSNKDPMSSSGHDASLLRKVGKPKEEKWKEMKSAEMEDKGRPKAHLKKVSPPVEKKWQSPKVEDEEAGKLYSSQHELLRRVKPPIEDKWRAKGTENESSPDPELDNDDLQSGNKTLIMLISRLSGRHDQKSAQDRALTILRGMKIGPDQIDTVDGSDPEKKERRDELFGISGVRGNYPQFFLVDSHEKISYFADWEDFESMHEMKTLSESMNLGLSSKYEGGDSRDSSRNSAAEFASGEASVSATTNQTDETMIETIDIPDQEPLPTQRMAPETKPEEKKGQKLEESPVLQKDNVAEKPEEVEGVAIDESTQITDICGANCEVEAPDGEAESSSPIANTEERSNTEEDVEETISTPDTNDSSEQILSCDIAETAEPTLPTLTDDANEREVTAEEEVPTVKVDCGEGEVTGEVDTLVAKDDEGKLCVVENNAGKPTSESIPEDEGEGDKGEMSLTEHNFFSNGDGSEVEVSVEDERTSLEQVTVTEFADEGEGITQGNDLSKEGANGYIEEEKAMLNDDEKDEIKGDGGDEAEENAHIVKSKDNDKEEILVQERKSLPKNEDAAEGEEIIQKDEPSKENDVGGGEDGEEYDESVVDPKEVEECKPSPATFSKEGIEKEESESDNVGGGEDSAHPAPAPPAVREIEEFYSEEVDVGEEEVSSREGELQPASTTIDEAKNSETDSDGFDETTKGKEWDEEKDGAKLQEADEPTNSDAEDDKGQNSNGVMEEQDDAEQSNSSTDTDYHSNVEKENEEYAVLEQTSDDEIRSDNKYSQSKEGSRDDAEEGVINMPANEEESDESNIKAEASEQENDSTPDSSVDKNGESNDTEENDRIDIQDQEDEQSSDEASKSGSDEGAAQEENTEVNSNENSDAVDMNYTMGPVNVGKKSEDSAVKSNSEEISKRNEDSGVLEDMNAIPVISLSSFFTGKIF